jgi:circadian clock protein KaiC
MGTARQKTSPSKEREKPPVALAKSPTGIGGFDEITGGGLPRGRPSLVCGSAGCGKTLFAMEFLVRGAMEFGEPGVFVTFEERTNELVQNVASLGFDLPELQRRKLITIDQVRIERSEIEEAGDYDLEGLFVRLGHAIDTIGAKRVALDTVEALFSGFSNQAILRAELRRLFMWLKEKGVTAVITGERGEGQLTRQGLEEYVSDCVVLLDHRVINQISTRRLRIVKYRGSSHGTNEYPFLIDEQGINVLPVTSAGLSHKVSEVRVSSGLPDLDDMLGGGIYQGASVLVTGTPGTGKSTLGATFADAACSAGGRCLYFAFEESPRQIVRNMKSVGMDLDRHIKSDRLRINAARPSLYGLETHLAVMHKQIIQFDPAAVVIDPLSSLSEAGTLDEVQPMVLRLVDMLKARGITALFTTLTHGGEALEATQVGISSLMDTWILLRDTEVGAERNRLIYVLKSRGTAHSNQVREFIITSQGLRLIEVSLNAQDGEVLTGSARLAQELKMRQDEVASQQAAALAAAQTQRQRQVLEGQIATLTAELKLLEAQSDRIEVVERTLLEQIRDGQEAMAASRRVRLNGSPAVPRRNGKTRRES